MMQKKDDQILQSSLIIREADILSPPLHNPPPASIPPPETVKIHSFSHISDEDHHRRAKPNASSPNFQTTLMSSSRTSQKTLQAPPLLEQGKIAKSLEPDRVASQQKGF